MCILAEKHFRHLVVQRGGNVFQLSCCSFSLLFCFLFSCFCLSVLVEKFFRFRAFGYGGKNFLLCCLFFSLCAHVSLDVEILCPCVCLSEIKSFSAILCAWFAEKLFCSPVYYLSLFTPLISRDLQHLKKYRRLIWKTFSSA